LKALTIDGLTVEQLIIDKIGVTGEKMELDLYGFVKGASTISYIHPGNKLATLAAFNLPNVDAQVMKDIAMQIAAMSPISIDRSSVSADVITKELDIAKDKARQEGKPENMLDKIAEGRLNKFYQESTLLEQAFIKDAKLTIAQYLKEQNSDLTVVEFKRVTLNQE